jgi:hypothetical protein
VLLDETTLRRQVGGPAVMAVQLTHIARLARRGRIRLHVVPHMAGAHALALGSLVLMRFDDEPPVAYVEGVMMGRVEDEPATVAAYHKLYTLAMGDALCWQKSLALTESVAEEYEHAV